MGSAIVFLRAPISYEVVRSRYVQLAHYDFDMINLLIDEMAEEARSVVTQGADDDQLEESRLAFMRYVGQGHEIAVPLPVRSLGAGDDQLLRQAFETEYAQLYGRAIPDQDLEILTWTLTLSAHMERPVAGNVAIETAIPASPSGERNLFDAEKAEFVRAPVYLRDDLKPGMFVTGPALIEEDQTTTAVTASFKAGLDERGYLVLNRI